MMMPLLKIFQNFSTFSSRMMMPLLVVVFMCAGPQFFILHNCLLYMDAPLTPAIYLKFTALVCDVFRIDLVGIVMLACHCMFSDFSACLPDFSWQASHVTCYARLFCANEWLSHDSKLFELATLSITIFSKAKPEGLFIFVCQLTCC